ncbi:hypothetical protein EB796_018130 [Bugula neritina]|uniref:Uncharacterized protein n=1 Tax=Bugula neritina TaxID=10212 RepID=A0A7J7JBD5_BUGNE|nr:hypothetical protein EB796_018130 [Bugula neritina]
MTMYNKTAISKIFNTVGTIGAVPTDIKRIRNFKTNIEPDPVPSPYPMPQGFNYTPSKFSTTNASGLCTAVIGTYSWLKITNTKPLLRVYKTWRINCQKNLE